MFVVWFIGMLAIAMSVSCCEVDLCDNITCLNNGQCVLGICKCTPGYDGEECNINLCEITNCSTESTPCVPILAPGGYTCSCVKRITTDDSSYYDKRKCDARSIITPLQTYDFNLNVTTTIPGVPGKNLIISFIDDFSIDSSDYLEIGGTRYRGYTTPADITLPNGADAQVRFVTDNFASDNGYTFTYHYIDVLPDNNHCKNGGTPTTKETCICMPGFRGGNCEFPAIVTSGGDYLNDQNISFTLPGFPEKELVLTFDADFSIATTNGNCSDILRHERTRNYVEIEGKRYCGGVAPGPITIPTGSGTVVRFVSDSHCTTGFILTYVYREP